MDVGLAEQRVRHHQPEHRVAEELERLVVDHAARDIFGSARLVGERVLEQPAIAETVADARLQLLELVAQPDPRDPTSSRCCSMMRAAVSASPSATEIWIGPSMFTAIGRMICVLPVVRKLSIPWLSSRR